MADATQPPGPWSFSTVRLLLVVVVFALVFAFTRHLGPHAIWVGLLIAMPVSGIVLLARRRDAVPIARAFGGAILGLFLGCAICPTMTYGVENPIHQGITGTIVGWMCAVLFSHLKQLERPPE